MVPTLLWARLKPLCLLAVSVTVVWTGAIGFLDDYLKVVQQNTRGLVGRYKLVGPVGFGRGRSASASWCWPTRTRSSSNWTTIPFLKIAASGPGVFYIPSWRWSSPAPPTR